MLSICPSMIAIHLELSYGEYCCGYLFCNSHVGSPLLLPRSLPDSELSPGGGHLTYLCITVHDQGQDF